MLGFIGVGFFLREARELASLFAPNGFRGIMSGASLISSPTLVSMRFRPLRKKRKIRQRDLPIGMITSLIVCTVLYIAVTLVLTGMVPVSMLAVGDPLAVALHAAGLDRLAGVFSAGAVIAMTAVLLVFQMGQPRIFMSMARDGLLPKVAARNPSSLFAHPTSPR